MKYLMLSEVECWQYELGQKFPNWVSMDWVPHADHLQRLVSVAAVRESLPHAEPGNWIIARPVGPAAVTDEYFQKHFRPL